jgi:hypothetical protein
MSQGFLKLRLSKDEQIADHDLYHGPPPALASHPLFGAGGARIGLMTAEAPRFPVSDHGGNAALESHLKGMGLKYEPTHGSYGGPENSFFIHNPTRQQMLDLGKKFGQEAVLYGEGGKHELHYTAGPHEGKYHPSLPAVRYTEQKPEDFYTHVPGKGFVTLNFDFDKMHPASNIKETPEAPMAKSNLPSRYPPHHRMNFRRTVGHGVLLTAAEHAQLQSVLGKSEPLATPEDIKKALLDALKDVLRKNGR